MEDLQRAIDSSLATASPLARRIYANDRWSAASVERFVNKVMAATVATVRADGRPHAAVVLTACLEGTVYSPSRSVRCCSATSNERPP